jgi:predicted nucleic-acid-binding protein
LKITADTNLLIRLVTKDNVRQAQSAMRELEQAELVAISSTALCELVWVLRQNYNTTPKDIASVIRLITSAANVFVDDAAVAAVLAVLEAGGDFVDGIIAHDGQKLGGDVFVTFDKRAIKELKTSGIPARLPD